MQKEDRCRRFKQVTIASASGIADRQAESSGTLAIRPIEEPLAAQLALRRIFSHITIGDPWRVTEMHGREMQIRAIRPDKNSVAAHWFNAVGSMGEGELEI